MSGSKRGVLFYNRGTRCLASMAVAMHSFRAHSDLPATLIQCGDEGEKEARALAAGVPHVDFMRYDFPRVTPGHAAALLCKCCLHECTPYEISLLLDADTLTQGRPDAILNAAVIKGFAVAQFSDWRTRGRIRKRIEEWRPIIGDEWTDEALAFGPAINTGVYAFSRDSDLMRDWYALAVKNRQGFIPDETCCQVMLPRYPANILTAGYNASCRYPATPIVTATVIHFHGKKHCRIEGGKFANHSDIWLRFFETIRYRPEVQAVIGYDRMLKKNLPEWDRMKG